MESDIYEWINDRLSMSYKIFNDMPACPFAKQALIDKKIRIIELNNKNEFYSVLKNCITNWDEDIEVVILGCDPSTITADELSNITEDANNTFLKNDYLALEDHPDYLEFVGDFCVNEGNWALILLQKKSKINLARKILEKRGYYKNWSKDYYKEVVLNRS